MNNRVISIARKEFAAFFSSPLAILFIGAFVSVLYFTFFWVETFFARNIADARPLFEWLPLLLIFLTSALTMRMWSDEHRTGTIELLLTFPISSTHLVIGKFLACFLLVALALGLTFTIPLTVSSLGNLDWGPVLGGYLAALLLTGAYLAVGLWISSKTDNQIVALILSVVVCSGLYLLGNETLTGLFGSGVGQNLQELSTGTRFASITRGILDIADLYYFLCVTAIFLVLNVHSVNMLTWDNSTEGKKNAHFSHKLKLGLIILNLLVANIWIQQIHSVRFDLTRGKIFSISPATQNILRGLQEPLLIRGYFSDKTHPLLAPLVPQIKDLIREYEIAGSGRVDSEFVDPRSSSEVEELAARRYNIRPVPFQISDKYQASIVNSYFNVVIQYGDRFEVLDFNDLIEVKVSGQQDVEVQLKNPEYDITRAIKKVVQGFQSVDSLLGSLAKPVTLTLFASLDQRLPEQLRQFTDTVSSVAQEYKQKADGSFTFERKTISPDSTEAKNLLENYGIQPMVANLFNQNAFYYHLVLEDGEKKVVLGLPGELDKSSLEESVNAALKRFSAGVLKTVGLVVPAGAPQQPTFRLVADKLAETYNVKNLDISQGSVDPEADILLVAAPKDLDQKQVYAIDQFLMRGGTVLLSTSPYVLSRSTGKLNGQANNSGLSDWLSHHGIAIEKALVFDPQNENYPVPVTRNLGGFSVQEMRMVPYPLFVDVRSQGMNNELGITSGLPQVTINWPSPIKFTQEANKEVKYTPLLQSSSESWTNQTQDIQPDFNRFPDLGFQQGSTLKSYPIAAVFQGEFKSYFDGKDSPFKTKSEESEEENSDEKEQKEHYFDVIENSTDSARIILFASNHFLADETLGISASTGGTRFLNSLQLVENSIDWSLEDRALLGLRGRSQFSNTLQAVEQSSLPWYEYGNYLAGLLALLGIYLLSWLSRRNRKAGFEKIFA